MTIHLQGRKQRGFSKYTAALCILRLDVLASVPNFFVSVVCFACTLSNLFPCQNQVRFGHQGGGNAESWPEVCFGMRVRRPTRKLSRTWPQSHINSDLVVAKTDSVVVGRRFTSLFARCRCTSSSKCSSSGAGSGERPGTESVTGAEFSERLDWLFQ